MRKQSVLSVKLDPRFHQALLAAFSQRQLGDYSIDSRLTQEDIDALTSDAIRFLAEARLWLARAAESES